MGTIRTCDYQSWAHFKSEYIQDVFGDDVFRSGEYAFRGQSDDSWTLETSFDRWFRVRYRGAEGIRLTVADALIKAFRDEITRHYPDHKALVEADAAVTALAQHFGVPTRLLDWSDSPYIASFFAFSDAVAMSMNSKRVAVWALRKSAPVWNAEAGVGLVALQGSGNDRLRQQLGCFTLNRTPYRTLEEYVAADSDEMEMLVKAVIPTAEAQAALADLDAMGINHVTTFPEIAGCALAAQLRVLMGADGVPVGATFGTRHGT
jgi:hypothetical protein